MENLKIMKTILCSITLLLLVGACTNRKAESVKGQDISRESIIHAESEGYELTKLRCYVCHNPNSSSHDSILAPPLAAVKMRYQMQYKTEEEFVDAMVSWTIDPQESKALMRGAVIKFKTMPNQLFKEDEIHKIATYIYNSTLEEPKWFAAHQKEMHANGRMGQMNK